MAHQDRLDEDLILVQLVRVRILLDLFFRKARFGELFCFLFAKRNHNSLHYLYATFVLLHATEEFVATSHSSAIALNR